MKSLPVPNRFVACFWLVVAVGLTGLMRPPVADAQAGLDPRPEILMGARSDGLLSRYLGRYSSDPLVQAVGDIEGITLDENYRQVFGFTEAFLRGDSVIAGENVVESLSSELVGTFRSNGTPIGLGFLDAQQGAPIYLRSMWALECSKSLWASFEEGDLVVEYAPEYEVYLLRGTEAIALCPDSRGVLGEQPVPIADVQSHLSNWMASRVPPTEVWPQIFAALTPPTATPAATATPGNVSSFAERHSTTGAVSAIVLATLFGVLLYVRSRR